MNTTNLNHNILSEIDTCLSRIRNKFSRKAKLRLLIQKNPKMEQCLVTLRITTEEDVIVIQAKDLNLATALRSLRVKFQKSISERDSQVTRETWTQFDRMAAAPTQLNFENAMYA